MESRQAQPLEDARADQQKCHGTCPWCPLVHGRVIMVARGAWGSQSAKGSPGVVLSCTSLSSFFDSVISFLHRDMRASKSSALPCSIFNGQHLSAIYLARRAFEGSLVFEQLGLERDQKPSVASSSITARAALLVASSRLGSRILAASAASSSTLQGTQREVTVAGFSEQMPAALDLSLSPSLPSSLSFSLLLPFSPEVLDEHCHAGWRLEHGPVVHRDEASLPVNRQASAKQQERVDRDHGGLTHKKLGSLQSGRRVCMCVCVCVCVCSVRWLSEGGCPPPLPFHHDLPSSPPFSTPPLPHTTPAPPASCWCRRRIPC
jgi:hypothetical protein